MCWLLLYLWSLAATENHCLSVSWCTPVIFLYLELNQIIFRETLTAVDLTCREHMESTALYICAIVRVIGRACSGLALKYLWKIFVDKIITRRKTGRGRRRRTRRWCKWTTTTTNNIIKIIIIRFCTLWMSSSLKRCAVVDDRNPVGRTGIRGRGCLGRWGPNHAADPIVTR